MCRLSIVMAKPLPSRLSSGPGLTYTFLRREEMSLSSSTMGLESKLCDYADDSGAHLWYLRGKRFVTPRGVWPLDGLTSGEQVNPFAMLARYWGAGFDAVGDPRAPGFPSPRALELDRHTIVGYLKANGASDAWTRLMLASEGDARRMNALAVTMAEAAVVAGQPRTYGLAGGNDQRPKAIAAALGDRVKVQRWAWLELARAQLPNLYASSR
jgi:hypothetical protein